MICFLFLEMLFEREGVCDTNFVGLWPCLCASRAVGARIFNMLDVSVCVFRRYEELSFARSWMVLGLLVGIIQYAHWQRIH